MNSTRISTSFLISFAFSLAVSAQADSALAAAAQSMTLRHPIVVSDAVVTLGDLFSNAGEDHKWRLFTAPAPGRRLLISASRLSELLRQRGLLWDNPNRTATIAVARYQRIITHDEIEAALLAYLNADNSALASMQETREFTTPNRIILNLRKPVTTTMKQAQIKIASFRYRKKSDHFQAILVITSGEAVLQQYRIEGRIEQDIELAVLRRPLRRGEIVSAQDFEQRRFTATPARRRALRDPKAVIGMAAQRALSAVTALSPDSFKHPALIQKNQSVTLIYAIGGLRVAAQTTALNSGYHGDVIPLLNPRSHRIIKGRIAANGEIVALQGSGTP